METKEAPVRWFEDICKDDVAEAGGKGANLGEMTRQGVPVPPGFVVTSRAYFDFLAGAGLRPVISEAISSVDASDPAALGEASSRIKEAIQSAAMPSSLIAAIQEAYRRLGGGFVAVRSSATAEDLPKASFAGQHSTYLNVQGQEAVIDAVKACWASLFEAHAMFYREEKGFDHLGVGIAVPVQRMVDADVAGVMFTCEPVSNDPSKLFIEAVYGLGEALVSGQLSPDTYVVDKANMRLERVSVARQEWRMARGAGGDAPHEGANRQVAVPPEQAGQQKLDEASIMALVEFGKKLEAHYNHPQDIEWAVEDGTLYLLQTRAITTAASLP
ncbi:MAG: hypothetical protein J4N83_05145 [Chloroflexi bacterium]|nr:hypothetical protein [Chloroflexota bacterium]